MAPLVFAVVPISKSSGEIVNPRYLIAFSTLLASSALFSPNGSTLKSFLVQLIAKMRGNIDRVRI